MVGDRICGRVLEVVRDLLRGVLGVRHVLAALDGPLLRGEPVHLAAVDGFEGVIAAVVDVRDEMVGRHAERYRLLADHRSCRAIDAGQPSEQIVEAVVFLDDDDDMLDW